VSDRESALFLADHLSIQAGLNTIFVVGGSEMYRVFEALFNKIYLTEVHAPKVAGDAYFDYKFDRRRWGEVSREPHRRSEIDEYDFDFIVYERRIATVRQTELSVFLKEEAEIRNIVSHPKHAEISAITRRQAHKLNALAAELELHGRQRVSIG
jgi:hypothetical protein